MHLRAAVAALAVALPLATLAGGYDKATWGMSPAEVQKLYPGGDLDKPFPDQWEYSVVGRAEFAPGDVLLTFQFWNGKLAMVGLTFPKPGFKIDLRAAVGDLPDDAEATQLAGKIRSTLEARYGKPTKEDSSPVPGRTLPERKTGWLQAENDTAVLLAVVPWPSTTGNMVMVAYMSRDPNLVRGYQPKGK